MSVEPGEAAAAMEEDSIPLKIINQMGYGNFTNTVLKDADINSILQQLKKKPVSNPNCTPKQKGEISSSMVTFVSGHGNDLDIASRHTIVDAVLTLEFKFPELDYDNGEDGSYKLFKSGNQKGKKRVKKDSYLDILVPAVFKTEAAFRKAFETYIEKSVYLQIAMGEPGPSAPMSTAEKSDWTTITEFSLCSSGDVCLKNFSSSEVDIFIVENAYLLLQNYLSSLSSSSSSSAVTPLTDCDLIEFNRVIRHILRANFIEMWNSDATIKKQDDLWMKHYLKLIRATIKATGENRAKPKVWVLKRVSKSSFDRYYQLKPNEGEDPKYRVHEGLHIFDLRDEAGKEIPNVVEFNVWKEALKRESPDPTDKNEMLDTNNLIKNACETRFFDYVKTKFPITGITPANIEKNKAKRRAIAGILYSIESKELYLSEICLLGFLLGVLLTLYDPACRPVTHTISDAKGVPILSTTRSGLPRLDVDGVYNTADHLLTQYSQQEGAD